MYYFLGCSVLKNKSFDVSIITAVYNNAEFIYDCLISVQKQRNVKIQHIIIDGGSDDGTLAIIRNKIRLQDILISEHDNGIYDALNKGVALAEANLVGILHSDDIFYDDEVVGNVLDVYKKDQSDILFGDLIFITRDTETPYRTWLSSSFKRWKLFFGWMPPHPTCFYKRETLLRENLMYDINLKISSDYKYLLKLLLLKRVCTSYLGQTVTLMRAGGASTGSLSKHFYKLIEDFRIIISLSPLLIPAIFFKRLIKIKQYFKF